MSKQEYPKKSKAKKRYRLKDNAIVVGVTTITGQGLGWNTETLGHWHNKMGLEGIDTRKYVNDLADIGTLGHKIVTDWLLKQETNFDDYSKNQINVAENCALSFFEWAKNKKIEPILIEKPLVSEKHRFGGQADIYGIFDGVHELIDLKTGSGIYSEMIIQVVAYSELLIENGYPVEKVRILNIPRSEDESFLEKLIESNHRKVAWEIFLNCLSTHQLRKKLK